MSSNFSQAPGTNLSLSCVHNSSIQIVIACQEDGRWEPDPHTFSSICYSNESHSGESKIPIICKHSANMLRILGLFYMQRSMKLLQE